MRLIAVKMQVGRKATFDPVNVFLTRSDDMEIAFRHPSRSGCHQFYTLARERTAHEADLGRAGPAWPVLQVRDGLKFASAVGHHDDRLAGKAAEAGPVSLGQGRGHADQV